MTIDDCYMKLCTQLAFHIVRTFEILKPSRVYVHLFKLRAPLHYMIYIHLLYSYKNFFNERQRAFCWFNPCMDVLT